MSHPELFIAGAIIAGGENSRMSGADKCLLTLGEESILDLLVKKLTNQTSILMLNANGDPTRFGPLALPIVSDIYNDLLGPVGGIVSCMQWLIKNHPTLEWLATTPSDTPFIPSNYLENFKRHLNKNDAKIFYTKYGERDHYLHSLWHISLVDFLKQQLEMGERSVHRICAKVKHAKIDFSDLPQDPFFNINTPEDFALAQKAIQPSTPK